MLISGALGASNQAVNSASGADKAKVESNNNGISFLGVAREVSETLSGKIVVAGGSNVKSPDFLKERFGYTDKASEDGETVYDFIKEI